MKLATYASAAAILVASSLAATGAQARDQISIVGSSTVFPFATAVAERFGQTSDFPTPVVESTGSGGGLKLFCEGVGEGTPDITNASRRIKNKEIDKCNANGVTAVEVKVGFDGIVLSNAKSGADLNVTREQIFLHWPKTLLLMARLLLTHIHSGRTLILHCQPSRSKCLAHHQHLVHAMRLLSL